MTKMRIDQFLITAIFLLAFLLLGFLNGTQAQNRQISGDFLPKTTFSTLPRKLFGYGMRADIECSMKDVSVAQGPGGIEPNGIPKFLVEITNVCASGCSMTNIHLKCGSFSSATLINPNVFKRIAIDDCLVNNGQPLPVGQALSFDYANSFSYPLSVSSATPSC